MDLLKGTLDVLILKIVSWAPLHGYGISRALRERTDEVLGVEEGALSPALRRLEAQGMIQGEWGRTETGREARFYRLTAEGERRLEGEVRQGHRYVEAMGRILGAGGTAP